jgi:nucleoside-diphosphate-sugar epimerase
VKRVLVTGATGFVGRAVCAALSGRARVRATARRIPAGGPWDEAVAADLSAAFDASLLSGVDLVLHCAGTAHAHGARLDDDGAFAAGNVGAVRGVCAAAAAAGVARVVLVSSVAVLGDGGPSPVPEDARPAPANAYARSKLAAEKIVRASVPEPVVLRLPLVYGPGLPGNLARMIDAVEARRFPPVPAGKNRRSMIHVDDAARAVVLAGENPRAAGRTFTVTDGRGYATHEIRAWIDAALGRSAPVLAPPRVAFAALARAGDAAGRLCGRRMPFDSDAYRKLFGSAEYAGGSIGPLLGFAPEWDLERAMPAIVAARRARDSA